MVGIQNYDLHYFLSANSKVTADTGPIVQALKAFRSDDDVAFKASLDKMDETYMMPHEPPAGCVSLRWGLCYSLATVALDPKKIKVLKAILESTNNQCEMAFEAEYNHLRQMPNTNRKILRVIDESGYKSTFPPGKSHTILDIIG